MYATHGRTRRVRTLALIAGAFVLSSLGAAKAAEQSVAWTRPSNVAIRGNALVKSGGCDGCDDAGAVSRQMIRSGDGYVEFRVTDPYAFWMAGLSQPYGSPRFDDIDFGFRFNGNGWADVLENGSYQSGSDVEADTGDVFRVAIVDGRVQYMKNGRLVRESQRAPRYPLAFAAALGTIGTRVADARIELDGRFLSNNRYGDPDTSEFSNLDRNRDGAIARSEWTGSLTEFRTIDRNRDGRISRAEFGRNETDSYSPVGTSGRQVIVDSRERWTNTGIWVRAGDIVSFDADGSIQMSTNPDDVSTPAGGARQAAEAPLSSRPAGLLIARIGNAAPIAVGNHRTIRAPVDGQLLLGVNDDHLPDNSGEYQVSISVDAR